MQPARRALPHVARAHGVATAMLSLLLAAWVAGQGQALEMSYPAEPGLTGVTVRWSGHARAVRAARRPLARDRRRRSRLAARRSRRRRHVHATRTAARASCASPSWCAPSNIRRRSCRSRSATSSSAPRIRRARTAKAPRRARSTTRSRRSAIGATPFEVPVRGAKDGRNFGHRRVFNGQPRAPHSGADLRAHDGHADLRGEPRPRRPRQGAVLQRQRRLHRPRLRPLSRPTCTCRRSTSPSATSWSEASSSAWPARRGASRARICIGACGSSTPASTRSRWFEWGRSDGASSEQPTRAQRSLSLRQRQEIQALLRPQARIACRSVRGPGSLLIARHAADRRLARPDTGQFELRLGPPTARRGLFC